MPKLTIMKKIGQFTLFCSLAAVLAVSCSIDQRYEITDIKEIDSKITLFQDGLDIPLGYTAQLHPDSLFQSFSDVMFTQYLKPDENGDFHIRYSGEYTKSGLTKATGFNTFAAPCNLDEVALIWLKNVPSQFKEIDLELIPSVILEVTTDFNIPVIGKITLTPDENVGRTVVVEGVELPYSSQEGTTAKKTIIIGRDVEPGTDHYAVDLSPLTSRIPETIAIKIESTGTAGNPAVEPKGEKFSFKYTLDIPALFENSPVIKSPFKDSSLSSEVTDFLAYGSVEVNAKASSTLPSDLALEISLLDANGQKVELEKKCILEIPAGPTKSEVSLNPIVLSIKDKEHKAVKMHFDMTVKPVQNKQFNVSQYIELHEMYLRLAEGITIEKK